MRSAMPLLLLLAMATAVFAQSPEEEGEENLQKKLEEKLKKPFASNAAWVLRFDEAKKLAEEKGKVIFAYFSRSYQP